MRTILISINPKIITLQFTQLFNISTFPKIAHSSVTLLPTLKGGGNSGNKTQTMQHLLPVTKGNRR
jgi:hypothetical protein